MTNATVGVISEQHGWACGRRAPFDPWKDHVRAETASAHNHISPDIGEGMDGAVLPMAGVGISAARNASRW